MHIWSCREKIVKKCKAYYRGRCTNFVVFDVPKETETTEVTDYNERKIYTLSLLKLMTERHSDKASLLMEWHLSAILSLNHSPHIVLIVNLLQKIG